jgi:hypothetical protein
MISVSNFCKRSSSTVNSSGFGRTSWSLSLSEVSYVLSSLTVQFPLCGLTEEGSILAGYHQSWTKRASL